MIKFIAHTVREFATEKDFKQFMKYLNESRQFPPEVMEHLNKGRDTSYTTMDGENSDCKSISTWKIETGSQPAEKK